MTTNGNEPLVALWAERNRLLALANVAGEKVKSPDGRPGIRQRYWRYGQTRVNGFTPPR